MRVAIGLIHYGRRGLERGLGFTMASNVEQAAADIATGDVIGSAVYQENLAAAKQQPDFNQAQFDAWWNCGLQNGFANCPEPTFEAYAGTAVSNRPSVLPSNVVASVTPIAAAPPAPTKPAAKSTAATTPAVTQQQLQAATTTPPVQAGTVPVTTTGTTTPTGNFLTGSMFGGIPNWLLFGGLAAAGYFAMRATR